MHCLVNKVIEKPVIREKNSQKLIAKKYQAHNNPIRKIKVFKNNKN